MAKRDIRFAVPKKPREQLLLYAQSVDELVASDAPVRAFVALMENVDWGPWEAAYAGCGGRSERDT